MSTINKPRRSMPKVRTGCATCKIRRIKCDEQRPKCHRCLSTGRSCPGYLDALGPRPEIRIYNIPFKVPGSRADRELLHFYCCEAAECLSRFSGTTLWTQLILQRSQHQPVIRNSLVALSALYRDYLRVGSSQLQVSPKHIQLIARSHSHLRAHLRHDASPEAALLCSLVFYIFECLVGNFQLAIWHLDQGLRLLKSCLNGPPSLGPRDDTIYVQLAAVYSRLDIHASIFSFERIPILELASPSHIAGRESIVPEQFVRISDAEKALAVLQNWTLRHLTSQVQYKQKPQGEIPTAVWCERMRLDGQFVLLESAIEQLASRPEGPSYTISERHRMVLLQTEALVFHGVLLENILLPSGSREVPLEALCRMDLALAHISSLLSAHRGADISTSRQFTLSTNVIAMLYFICMKTKSRWVLRTALSMLQGGLFAVRDGLWDASTAARVVQGLLSDEDLHEDTRDMGFKLEDVGSGIVDVTSGLDDAFKMLQISQSCE